MNVYLIETGDYDEREIIATCSSKKKADDLVSMFRRWDRSRGQNPDRYRISKYVLDGIQNNVDAGYSMWYVTIKSQEIDSAERVENSPYFAYRCLANDLFRMADGHHYSIWAKDEETAIKIAKNKLAKWIKTRRRLS